MTAFSLILGHPVCQWIKPEYMSVANNQTDRLLEASRHHHHHQQQRQQQRTRLYTPMTTSAGTSTQLPALRKHHTSVCHAHSVWSRGFSRPVTCFRLRRRDGRGTIYCDRSGVPDLRSADLCKPNGFQLHCRN